jgi:formylglycine-generating enzyme required for sulfatase activity
VRTDTDPMNCGGCRNVCAGGRICAAGMCVQQRSCPSAMTPGCGVVSLVGGSFTVGAPVNCSTMPSDPACGIDAAPPVSDVRVSAFQLDAYEVTVARFRVFWADRVRDNGASLRASPVPYPNGTSVAWLGAGREPTGPASFNWSSTAGMREAHPMNGVDFWTAMEFCVWDGGRLPTEVEWEYAARGRVTGRIYPWGDVPPPVMMCTERAHWALCSGEDGALTRRVGQFPSTPGPFYDLGGNVLEWTADTRSTSRTLCWRGTVDPLCQEAASGTAERQIRGGSYFTVDTPSMRAASRATLNASAQSSVVGFRCAR